MFNDCDSQNIVKITFHTQFTYTKNTFKKSELRLKTYNVGRVVSLLPSYRSHRRHTARVLCENMLTYKSRNSVRNRIFFLHYSQKKWSTVRKVLIYSDMGITNICPLKIHADKIFFDVHSVHRNSMFFTRNFPNGSGMQTFLPDLDH